MTPTQHSMNVVAGNVLGTYTAMIYTVGRREHGGKILLRFMVPD